ncbi:hypothetical protein [uncultured Lamprocystis sp.]|jgi:hypothetical protein|uniref:hypothetical protein n=1 Tax=uncultured Lamprocystis sp. TaxID=543132 RepID=UPI0025E4B80B|nr:hypothetical protein [uncultured Lamprocystis sp.]
MCNLDIENVSSALSAWEEAVKWIADGWDCCEEYHYDLTFRETLQKAADTYTARNKLPSEIIERIANADREFRDVTVASALSVWDVGPHFRYCEDTHIELIPLSNYDRGNYWYYYRWQPDCPYDFRNHNGLSYQKAVYGLDFATMSELELLDAVRRCVSRWEIERLRSHHA